MSPGLRMVFGAGTLGLALLMPLALGAQAVNVALTERGEINRDGRDASVLDQPALLQVEGVELGTALDRLQRLTDIELVFSPSFIDAERLVSCDCGHATVSEALDKILAGTRLEYRELNGLIVIVPKPAPAPAPLRLPAELPRLQVTMANGLSERMTSARLQPGTITGTVTDRSARRPLAGVQIWIEVGGTVSGALTNESGHYRLEDVPAGPVTVRAQMLGYAGGRRSVTVSAGEVVIVDFALAMEAIGLDEIVVTGAAGEQRRRELGTSMGVISERELEMAPIRDIQDVFFGRTPGASLLANSGQPGAAGTLRLRGVNSISQGNMPLIYVDGVRVSNSIMMAGARNAGVSQGITPFNNINPDDIERIEVVRGAAASTLYGTEASGGVIQIFTKRGVEGSPQWSAEVSTGVNQIGYMGPSEDETGLWLLKCRGPELVDSEGVVFEDPTCPPSGSWAGNGLIQQYSLSVRGGTSDITYYLSGRFSDEQSPFDVGFDRVTRLRGNFTFQPLTDLNLNVNTAYTNRTTRWVPDGSNAAGFLVNVSRGNTGVYLDGDGNPHNAHGLVQRNHNWTDHFVSGLTARLQRGDITHRATVGYDFFLTNSETLYPFGNLHTPEGRMYKRNNIRATLTADYVGSWHRRMGESIRNTLSFGGQLYSDDRRDQTMQGRYYASPAEPTIASGAFTDVSTDSPVRAVTAGMFLQNVVDYRDRLYLTAGLRIDGHSAFGRDFGLQPYPKLGLAYVLSDHDFWPDHWWEALRLRAAVGDAGKAPGFFDAVETWQPVAGEDGAAGYSPYRLGNPDLGPERTREVELGFDASLLAGRLGVDLTYFHQDTYDALIPVRPPASQGFTLAQLENVGHLRNTGTEVSVRAGVLQRENFEWWSTLNFSTNFSEAIDLGGEEIDIGWRQGVREGYPVGAFIGNPVIVNPNEYAEPIIEEDGYHGPTEPTHTVGLRTELIFRQRLTLEVMGEYKGGHYQQNGTGYQNARRGAGVWRPCYEAQAALRAGAAGDPTALDNVTALERMKCALDASAAWHWWIQPADFFKLRSVSVAYALPSALLPGGIEAASLQVAGRNLWTITDYDGIDPEIGDAGAQVFERRDYYNLPPYRTFTLSLRVNF